MVEQKQTVLSRNETSSCGFSRASRRTRFSSVPIAHDDPAGAAARVWMIFSVEPTWSAAETTSLPALRVHQHLHAGHPLAHVVAPSPG